MMSFGHTDSCSVNQNVHEIQPTASDLDQLRVLPFVDNSMFKADLAKASQLNADNPNFDLLK